MSAIPDIAASIVNGDDGCYRRRVFFSNPPSVCPGRMVECLVTLAWSCVQFENSAPSCARVDVYDTDERSGGISGAKDKVMAWLDVFVRDMDLAMDEARAGVLKGGRGYSDDDAYIAYTGYPIMFRYASLLERVFDVDAVLFAWYSNSELLAKILKMDGFLKALSEQARAAKRGRSHDKYAINNAIFAACMSVEFSNARAARPPPIGDTDVYAKAASLYETALSAFCVKPNQPVQLTRGNIIVANEIVVSIMTEFLLRGNVGRCFLPNFIQSKICGKSYFE